MYFPFLYARQSEMLALRGMLSGTRPLDKLIPVLEPVNAKTADLIRCLDAFGTAGQPLVLIVNPDKHQLKTKDAALAVRRDLAPIFEKHASLVPGYRCHSGNKRSNVDAFLKAYPNRDVAMVYAKPALQDADVRSLAGIGRIKFHIAMHGEVTASQRDALPTTKLVEIRDNFKKQARNADYGAPELFTDQHKTFSSCGVGFGDYAAIGSAFQASGSTPYAVAIHAAYKHPDTQDIWVEHFVSDDKDKDVGDVASKYLQAAQKLVHAARKRPREFGSNPAIDAYRKYVSGSYYPGLAKNKEHQVGHHLCFMLDVLNGTL